MKIRINITAKDIQTAITTRHSIAFNGLTDCAVARAARRKKGYEKTTVGVSFIHLKDSNLTVIKLPNFVSENIVSICRGISIPPFKFLLELPDA